MVVIGTSFIGMEVASYLASSVECIDIAAVPFERVLGERIGKMLQKVRARPQEGEGRERERKILNHTSYILFVSLYVYKILEEKGIVFHLNAGVKEIVANDGKVTIWVW